MLHLVVPLDRLVQALRLQHVDDWGEGLPLHNARVVRQAGDDGRLDEEAGPVDHFAAALDFSALLDGLGDCAAVIVNGLLVVQWPVQCVRLEWVTDSLQ